MARLQNGARKRKDGSFELRFTYNKKRYSVYAQKSSELEEKKDELLKQLKTGTYTENRNITLDAYFEEWRNRKKEIIKPSTLNMYASYYKNNISPVLGSKKVKSIEKREIEQLITGMKERISGSSCNLALTILKTIFTSAKDDRIIIESPCNNVKGVKVTKTATESYHRALTEEEQKAFMKACRNNYYYEYFAFLLCSGMRQGELSALTWADVDFDKNIIHINKTLTRDENGKTVAGTSTKTTAGKRDIALTPTMKEIIKSFDSKVGNTGHFPNSTIFKSASGTVIYSDTINTNIKRIIEEMKKDGVYIDHFTAHAFRDTFATRFIEQGGTMQTLKTILGHESIKVTMDLYAQVTIKTKQLEMENVHIAI